MSIFYLNLFVNASNIKLSIFNKLTKEETIKLCRDTHPQTTLIMKTCLGYSISNSLENLNNIFTPNEVTEIHEFLKEYCKKLILYSYDDLDSPLGTLYPLNVGLCISETLNSFVEYSNGKD